MNGTGGMSNNANPNIAGQGSPQMFNMQMPPLSNAVQQQNRPGTNPQQMQQNNMASMPQAMMGAPMMNSAPGMTMNNMPQAQQQQLMQSLRNMPQQMNLAMMQSKMAQNNQGPQMGMGMPQAMMGANMINGAPGMAMNNMPQAQQQQHLMQSLRNMPQQMNLAMMQPNMAQNNQGPQMGMGMGMGMPQAMMGAQMINGAPGMAMNKMPQAQQQQLMQSIRNMPQQTIQRAQSSGSNIQNTVQPQMPQIQMMQQSQGMQESPNSHYEQNHSSGGQNISQNTMNTNMSGGDGIHGASGNSQGQQQSFMPDMQSMQMQHAQMAMFLQMQQKQQSKQQQPIVRAQPDQRPQSQSSNFQSNLPKENKNDMHKAPLIPSQENRHINTKFNIDSNNAKDLSRRRSQPSQQQMQMPSPMSQMQMSKELQLKLQRQMIDQIRESSVVAGNPNDQPGHIRQGKQKLKLPPDDIAEQSFDRTKGVRNNISPSSLSQNLSGFQGFEQTKRSVIQSPTKIPTPSNARLSSASTIRDVDPHHKLMKPEDACPLIDSMPWEEKVIYISRHVMGGRKGNGYFRTLSHLKRIRKKLSEDEPEAKMAKTFARPSDDHKNQETHIDSNHEIEKLKQHPTIAKSILGEMGLGITFCSTVASAIESVLSSISPDDNENGSGGNAIKPTRRKSTGSKRAPGSKGQAPKINSPQTENQVIQQSRNIHGTMSRKERDKQLSIPKMKDPIEAMVVADEKKPTKRELAFRHFETTRYRALKNGDFVAAAKFQESGAWILARVVHDQNEKDMSSADLKSLPKEKRGEFLDSRVVLQDIESFNAGVKDLNKMKMVARKSILPLPRNHVESNLWLYRCRKGFRVYAMYPSTTRLYPATVIDSTSFCINEDNICVVEFDGDAGKTMLLTRLEPPQYTRNHLTKLKCFLFPDEKTGKLHQKHIPGRFVTLIPKEYPVSKASRRKSGTNANSVRGKDGENKSQIRQNKPGTTKDRPKLEKQASSLDTLLMEGLGDLDGIDDIDLDDDLKSADEGSS